MKSLKFKIQNYQRNCGIPLRRDSSKFKISQSLNFVLLIVTLHFAFLTFNSSVEAAARYPISELGKCRNQKECLLYCSIPQNTPACWSYNRFVLSKNVLGETDTKITFPVKELGNCASAKECRAYCTKKENHAACWEFAIAHGLAKPSILTLRIIEAAKAELGCNSMAECRIACERPENRDICQSFARKHNLIKKAVPIAREIITQAKEALGCTDQASCKALCEKPENQEKCMTFGEKHKLLKKRDSSARFLSAKPGAPCANDKTCIQYCQEHPTECPGYEAAARALSELAPTGSGSPPAHAKFKIGDFLGPTGCLTEGECKAFCEKHPDKCPDFPKKPTSFPTIKLSIPANRSGERRGPGSINSGKGTFSDLFGKDPSKTPSPEDETEPTDTPDVDEPEATGATGPTTQ